MDADGIIEEQLQRVLATPPRDASGNPDENVRADAARALADLQRQRATRTERRLARGAVPTRNVADDEAARAHPEDAPDHVETPADARLEGHGDSDSGREIHERRGTTEPAGEELAGPGTAPRASQPDVAGMTTPTPATQPVPAAAATAQPAHVRSSHEVAMQSLEDARNAVMRRYYESGTTSPLLNATGYDVPQADASPQIRDPRAPRLSEAHANARNAAQGRAQRAAQPHDPIPTVSAHEPPVSRYEGMPQSRHDHWHDERTVRPERPRFSGTPKHYREYREVLLENFEYYRLTHTLQGLDRGTRQERADGFRIILQSVRLIQDYPKHLAKDLNESDRQRAHQCVRYTPSSTPFEALARLDELYQFTASVTRRQLHFDRLLATTQGKKTFRAYWGDLEECLAEFRSHGGSMDDEGVLNILERNASTTWAKHIASTRELVGDDIAAIIARLCATEDKHEFVHTSRDDLAATPVRRRTRPHQIHLQLDEVRQIFVQLDKKDICFACLKEGHKVFDKKPDGSWKCPVTAERAAAGTLPAVGNPGPNPPKGQQLKRPKRLFAINVDSDDEGGSDDDDAPDGATPGDSDTPAAADEPDAPAADAADATITIDLQQPSTVAVLRDGPSSVCVSRDGADHNAPRPDVAWGWDGMAESHATGYLEDFIPGTLTSPSSVSGVNPGVTTDTTLGSVRVRLRCTDGSLGPPVVLNSVHYVKGLRMRVISRNRFLSTVAPKLDRVANVLYDRVTLPNWTLRVQLSRNLEFVHGLPVPDSSTLQSEFIAVLTSRSLRADPHLAVGLPLRKYFDGKPYRGIVDSYVRSRRVYKIFYDDGDREELNAKELAPLLAHHAREEPVRRSQANTPHDDRAAARTASTAHTDSEEPPDTPSEEPPVTASEEPPGGTPSEAPLGATPNQGYPATAAPGQPLAKYTDEYWAVERILRRRDSPRGTEYLVRWEGFTKPTWEPRAGLIDDFAQELAVVDAAHRATHAPARSRPKPRHTDAPVDPLTFDPGGPPPIPARDAPANRDPRRVLNDLDDPTDDFGAEEGRTATRSRAEWSAKEQVNLRTHMAWGHRSHGALCQMRKLGTISPDSYYPDAALPFCVGCAKVATRKPDRSRFHHGRPPAVKPGELQVVDMVPVPEPDISGHTAILISVDYATRNIRTHKCKSADDILPGLKKLEAFWRRYGKRVAAIRSDRGPDLLMAESTKTWMESLGIHPEPTGAYDHNQAGMAEKVVDLVKSMALAWIKARGLPEGKYFIYAIAHAAAILSRTPRKIIDWRTPYTLATGKKFDATNIAPFGCDAYRHVDKDVRRSKVDDRARVGLYLGLDDERDTEEPGHLVYFEDTGKIVHSRHVEFNCDPLIRSALAESNRQMQSTVDAILAIEEVYGPVEKRPKDPSNRREMMQCPHAAQFLEAEIKEYGDLISMGVFEWVDIDSLRPEDEIIDLTWRYKYKFDELSNEITKYKARLCVRGDMERNTHPRFSAMAKASLIRLLIALLGAGQFTTTAAFDIGNAFATAAAPRRLIVNQPPGYYDGTRRAMLLKRSLYGQDDAGRAFWLEFEGVLMKKYQRSDADPCIFFKGSVANGDLVVIATHVDDAPVFAMRQEEIEELNVHLHEHFDKITRVDMPRQLIGMQIDYSEHGIELHQSAYVDKLVKDFAADLREFETPSADDHILDESNLAPPEVAKRFRSKVGACMYLACSTRPDISFAVAKCAQGMASPSVAHMELIDRVLGYLKKFPRYKLLYARTGDLALYANVDAEHGSQFASRKSVTGFCMRLGQQAVFDWSASVQKIVTKSSTEAELVAMSDKVDTIVVARLLLKELRLLRSRPTMVQYTDHERSQFTDRLAPVGIFQDNQSAITIIQDVVYSGRTKHLDIRLKYLREQVRIGAVVLRYVRTALQLADVFTKGLPRRTFGLAVRVLFHGGILQEEE